MPIKTSKIINKELDIESSEVKNKEYEYCLRCGRRLRSLETRLKGYGLVCEHKMITNNRKRLF